MNEALNSLKGLISAVREAPAGSPKNAGLVVALGTAVASSEGIIGLIDGAQAMQAALTQATHRADAADTALAAEIALREATEARLSTIQIERDAALDRIERDAGTVAAWAQSNIDLGRAHDALVSSIRAEAADKLGAVSAALDQAISERDELAEVVKAQDGQLSGLREERAAWDERLGRLETSISRTLADVTTLIAKREQANA